MEVGRGREREREGRDGEERGGGVYTEVGKEKLYEHEPRMTMTLQKKIKLSMMRSFLKW